MARITVLGATGRTGQEVVAQALAAGHSVTALVRRPEALPIGHERLTVVVGDATDREVIRQVTLGQDGLIAALGRPESGTDAQTIDDTVAVNVCFESTKHLLDLAAETGLNRVVLMSTHGAGSSNDGSPYSTRLRQLVGKRVADKDDMEALLVASDTPVCWTVVRNPLIYDGPQGRPHAVHESIELDETSKITYADLSAFVLSELLEPRHPRTFLSITEPLTGSAAR